MTGKSHDHDISPAFERAFNRVKEYFFSRNPRYWPCFADPRFADILAFRKRRLSPEEGIAAWPDGPAIHARLTSRETAVPRRLTEPTGAFDAVLGFTAALSKNWEDPASVENVITMPCDPGIYGAMLGSLVNPNLVYRDYAGMAAELEHAVIRQVARLAGYDVERATGIFTQGGTFCNLYGYLTGIRKSLPQARLSGMGNTPDYRIINSQGGHYSNITSLSLLGVDIRQRAIRIKIGENNEMDLGDLKGTCAPASSCARWSPPSCSLWEPPIPSRWTASSPSTTCATASAATMTSPPCRIFTWTPLSAGRCSSSSITISPTTPWRSTPPRWRASAATWSTSGS